MISSKLIIGNGPQPTDVMLVGEAGGREEGNRGVPFVGKSGEELNRQYLPLAGLSRGRVRVNNIYPHNPPNNRDPNEEEIAYGWTLLLEDIRKTQPWLIIAAGRIAATQFAGREVVMEREHGIPFWWEGRVVVPVYHPAAGLHNTGMIKFIRQDFKVVRQVLNGELVPLTKQHLATVEYEEVTTVPEMLDTLTGECQWLAIDTETADGQPWSIQYSTKEGRAYLVRTSALPLLGALRGVVSDDRCTVVLHNAKFDLRVLGQLGIHPKQFVDTMLAGYVLGSEASLSLKSLGYRNFGVEMREYRELVAESAARRAVEYISNAASREWEDSAPVVEYKGKHIHLRQPQNVGKRLRNLLSKHGDDGHALREKWGGMKEMEQVIDALGEMPGGSIAEIPISEAVRYACQDADVTLRLWNVFKPRLEEEGLMGTFKRDCSIVPMVVDMEEAGMPVDRGYFKGLEGELIQALDETHLAINKFMSTDTPRGHKPYLSSGEVYNPDSPTQCMEYCKYLGLRGVRNTEAENLKPFVSEYTGIRLHLAYKHYSKLLGTYVSRFANLSTGRLGTNINMVRTTTGRLSSSDPNLQNIPVRDVWGKKIRKGFVCQK
jgi:uracil-DNA glycosylase family 4